MTPLPYECDYGRCTNRAGRGRVCRKHREYTKVTGERGLHSTAAAAAHIARLRALGWSDYAIADAAGISFGCVYFIRTTDRSTARAATLSRILSVPVAPGGDRLGVDSTGTRRRVSALSFMGYPRTLVSVECGFKADLLATIVYRPHVSAAVAAAVKRFYDAHSNIPGPSSMASAKAKSFGAQPPMAWEFADIDDPKAKPFQGFREAA